VADAVRRPGSGATGERSRWFQRAVFLGPGLLYWFVLFVVPVGLILTYSFFKRSATGGIDYTFTLDNYVRAMNPLFLKVLLFSLRTAFVTTVIALVLGYMVAYFIATRPERWRLPLLVLIVLPFWTNLLIRTYAWILLLNNEGLVNRSLRGLGLIDGSLPLLNNEFAIVVGLLYAYLPLMILPLYASIERLGRSPREAAADLGASPVAGFFRITFPMTLPGVMAGCIFVFVPSLGNFVVPDLLGGGKSIMVGNLIQSQFFQARDWPFGATLALLVIAVTTVLLGIQAWILGRERRLVARGA
jgi:spermidine/putrescine transport system permease protein